MTMVALFSVLLLFLAHECFCGRPPAPPPDLVPTAGPKGGNQSTVISAIQPGSCGQTLVDPVPDLEPSEVEETGRIVGGEPAKPKSINWIVSIRSSNAKYDRNFKFNHVCGGALVRVNPKVDATDIVLTAAHCTPDMQDPSKIIIVAGAYDRTDVAPGEQTRNITQVVAHDGYVGKPDTYHNDIAIAKLDKPIQFSDTIQPACLPEKGERLSEGTVGLVAGWGLLENTKQLKVAKELQQLEIPIVNKTLCAQYYPPPEYKNYDDDVQFCAGYAEGGKDSCKGDSGGPLVFKQKKGFTLQGVVSFGKECALAERPGVYTRVSDYIDWINEQIKELSDVAKQ